MALPSTPDFMVNDSATRDSFALRNDFVNRDIPCSGVCRGIRVSVTQSYLKLMLRSSKRALVPPSA